MMHYDSAPRADHLAMNTSVPNVSSYAHAIVTLVQYPVKLQYLELLGQEVANLKGTGVFMGFDG